MGRHWGRGESDSLGKEIIIAEDEFELADVSVTGVVEIPGIDGLFALCISVVLREAVQVHFLKTNHTKNDCCIHLGSFHFQ